MKITPIASSANVLLKKVRGLQVRQMREKQGEFLVEGAKLVCVAFAKELVVTDVLVSKSFLASGFGEAHAANITEVSLVEDKLFEELVSTQGPCGIVAVAEMLRWSVDDLFAGAVPLVVIAEAIQDPGNLGTMIRTALAARASGMILTKGTVDPFNPKVVRSAAGALFMLPIVTDMTTEDAIGWVKKHGLSLITCQMGAEKIYWEADMTGPTALAFGNEGQGFSASIVSQADDSVSIPMHQGSESLNVSISAGIILFGAVQQRAKQQRAVQSW